LLRPTKLASRRVDLDICLSLHQVGRVVGEAVDKAITIQLALPEVCVLDEVAVQDPDVGLKGPLRSRPLAPSAVRTNYAWADLLRRVFKFDVLVCPECGGAARIVAVITRRDVICKILDHLGLPKELPRLRAERAPPEEQLEIDLWADHDDAA